MRTETQERVLFSVKDAGRFLSLSPRTIFSLINNGELRPTKIGRRTLLHRDILEKFARRDHPTSQLGEQDTSGGVAAGERGGARK